MMVTIWKISASRRVGGNIWCIGVVREANSAFHKVD